jgi:predicted regulator of Ras-like GTPase activity (Roadblock/LC7/MglB family)
VEHARKEGLECSKDYLKALLSAPREASVRSSCIAVEKVIGEAGNEANLDVAAAEFTSLVRSAQRAGTDTGLGKLRELVVSLDTTIIMMRLLGQDYFVVLALTPEGNLGRGRYELRKAELKLTKEFAL